MDILELKKLALLGITGGLLFAATGHNTVYAGDHSGSDHMDKEAHGCKGMDSCDGKDGCDGKDEVEKSMDESSDEVEKSMDESSEEDVDKGHE